MIKEPATVHRVDATIPVIGVTEDPETWRYISECFAGLPAFLLIKSSSGVDEIDLLGARLGQVVVVLAEPHLLHEAPSQTMLPLLSGGMIRLLAFTPEEDDGESLLRAGCMGVIDRGSPPHLFRKAVQTVAAGEMWASRKVMSRLLRASLALEGARILTRRETKILELICEGYSNQAVAEKLYVSRETVRWHLRSLYSKLGASSRQAAIQIAVNGGWTSPGGLRKPDYVKPILPGWFSPPSSVPGF
ncbi:MAG TPA: response regulator transcription factor [Bryobacteraceae bacterium]|jgi:DNA-binding CsgD family transcriptional regulator|nr:response regulator transcription factor [Bryobacteraceae bacterium]